MAGSASTLAAAVVPSAAAASPTGFDALPDDCVRLILTRLASEDLAAFGRLRRASRRTNQLGQDAFVLRPAAERRFPELCGVVAKANRLPSKPVAVAVDVGLALPAWQAMENKLAATVPTVFSRKSKLGALARAGGRRVFRRGSGVNDPAAQLRAAMDAYKRTSGVEQAAGVGLAMVASRRWLEGVPYLLSAYTGYVQGIEARAYEGVESVSAYLRCAAEVARALVQVARLSARYDCVADYLASAVRWEADAIRRSHNPSAGQKMAKAIQTCANQAQGSLEATLWAAEGALVTPHREGVDAETVLSGACADRVLLALLDAESTASGSAPEPPCSAAHLAADAKR